VINLAPRSHVLGEVRPHGDSSLLRLITFPTPFAARSRASRAGDVEARLRRMMSDHAEPLWRFLRRLGVPEGDIDDADRRIPVDTTGQIELAVGKPVPATAVPIKAVTIEESKATFFTVEGGVAHKRTVVELGEAGPDVFFKPDVLAPGTDVVLEGHALLSDGDRVAAKPAQPEMKGSEQ